MPVQIVPSSLETVALEQTKIALEQAQWIVHGYVQLIEGDTQMLVNEDGRLLRLPHNKEATRIAHENNMIAPNDFIVGVAILLTGDSRWLPDEEPGEDEESLDD